MQWTKGSPGKGGGVVYQPRRMSSDERIMSNTDLKDLFAALKGGKPAAAQAPISRKIAKPATVRVKIREGQSSVMGAKHFVVG